MMLPLQTDQVDALVKDLVLAQKEIDHAHKDSKNPHFKSSYASLESVIDATKPILAKYNIVITQLMLKLDSELTLVTTMLHASGQYVRSFTPILSEKGTAQALGSGLSYARRYAWAAITGVAQTDDDGNEASAPDHKTLLEPIKTASKSEAVDLGEYIAGKGKFAGKRLKNLDPYELNSYCEFLKNIQDPNATVIEFLKHAEAFLKSREFDRQRGKPKAKVEVT